MSCVSQFAKYVIFIFNFLIAACAIVLIVFGIIYFMDEDSGVNVFSDIGSFFSLGILAICLGVIILFISGFGCCGALHENTCLLTIYAVILIILFVIQLVLGILAVMKVIDKDDFRSYVRDLLSDLFNSDDKASIKTFYNIQKTFECCGVDSFGDYNLTVEGYPSSCCEKGRTPCFQPFTLGCADGFTDAISEYIQIIGYVALGFAAIELLGAVFSFLVRRENKQNKVQLMKRDSYGFEKETDI